MSAPVTTAELAERLGEHGLVVLDVRTMEEFSGLAVAPCDPRPGRIPGARRVGLDELFGASASGPAAVRQLVGADEGAEVIAYCHSGIRSATAVQLLAEAGIRARNYEGSWHEWSREPSLPAETGAPERPATS
jgi:thiosulfate/3-mercaptopyruvate sulfurtransferase